LKKKKMGKECFRSDCKKNSNERGRVIIALGGEKSIAKKRRKCISKGKISVLQRRDAL